MKTMTFPRIPVRAVLTIAALAVMTVEVTAVAPTPEAIEKWKAEGVWEEKVANWKAFKKAGGCSPEEHSVFDKEKRRQNLALGTQAVTTANVIVILVDFSDWQWDGQSAAGTPADFDSILFSDPDSGTIINPTGSMTEFYLENSYGQFYLKGDIKGWYRMPQQYSWYVGTDYGLTRGRILATDAVDAAHNAGVDFSKYDLAPPIGVCDGLIIIHAGRGAEEEASGIWSHKSTLSEPRTYDGVSISAYTMNPEEAGFGLSPIGVFCHEYGHFLKLPDLYDTYDDNRAGLGVWSLMASGNYLGDSKKPAHLDAWCKATAGFLDFIEVSSNVFQETIPAVESNPVAYKLKNSSTGAHEYWVVENRQRLGFDLNLPGEGLCIYHVDTLAPANNTNYMRYYVAMEQADGKNDLADTIGNRGDSGDPWTVAFGREFHDQSAPNSRTNVGGVVTKIGVWRISDSDSLMTADFDIEYSRPWVDLISFVFTDDPPDGDGDSIPEAGETIQFYCTIKNEMRGSYNPRATLSTNNPSVTFLTNDVLLDTLLFSPPQDNADNPIEFTIADSLLSVIDSFFLTITTDSLQSAPGSGEFSKTFVFEVQLGAPQVLIVDDDRGDSYEAEYEDVFYNLRIPTKTWRKQIRGSPTGAALRAYSIVFWHTGDSAGNVLNTSDIAAMKDFMDNGGSLLLTTVSGVIALDNLDSAFLADYFHAAYVSDDKFFNFEGVSDNPVGDGTTYRHISDMSRYHFMQLLTPVNGGQAAFAFSNDPNKICGVTYTSTHKSILLTFPVEFINDDYAINPGFYPKDTLLRRALEFFGGIATSVYDGQPFGQLPQNFELHQNYPNPFNPVTNISYTLRSTGGFGRQPARTHLSIYNLLGQRVRTLVDKVQIPGTYVVQWDGADSFSRPVASGVYFYRLERGGDSEAKKMILVR